MTSAGQISLDILEKDCLKTKFYVEEHKMPFALEKTILAEVSGNIQSRIRHPEFKVRLRYFQEC